MRHSSIISRNCVAILGIAALAALTGCSNLLLGPVSKNSATTSAAARPTWVSGDYTLTKVNFSTQGNNEIAGINNNSDIVLNFSTGTTYNATWTSYVSKPSDGQYNSFTIEKYPGYENTAGSTYLYAISNDSKIKMGYVVNPGGEKHAWGVVENGGLWSLTLREHDEEACDDSGGTSINELLGFDDTGNSGPQIAVGYYSSSAYTSSGKCTFRPYAVQPGDNLDDALFNNVPSNWINVQATGIDSSDEIVGSTKFIKAAFAPAGWFQSSGTNATPKAYWYRTGSKPGDQTTFNGIATVASLGDEIVGSFVDSSGTHGLVWEKTSNTWTKVDGPPGTTYTVVNGINRSGDICGWYRDGASGYYFGFVGIPGADQRKRR